MKGNRRWLKATLIVGLWVACAGAVFAQTMNAGDIRGIVTDSTGAAVPGVTVSVVNKNTGVEKDLVTNQDGLYDTSSIVAGSYEITFSKAGFSKLVRSNITVEVKDITVNAQLSVGAVSEQVIVNTDVPLLETENGEQSTTLTATTLQQLPEVGQDWQHFVNLIPGATGAPGGSQGSADPQQVAAINGNLPFSTVLADGASVTLPSSANADVMVLETVQEVRVSSSAFSAQYGVGGIMFNQISKGGTSNFHGAAYEYVQNTALNAASYSFGTGTVPVQHYNNFGGSIGGPILKKKMFFYFNYDKINNKSGGSPSFQTMPSTAFLNGDFTAPGVPTIYDPATTTLTQATGTRPFPQNPGKTQTCPCYDRISFAAEYGNGNRIPASRFDPLAKNVKAYYPAVNNPGSTSFTNGYQTNNFVSAIPNNNPFTKYFGRLDWDIRSNNRLTISEIESDNPAYNNGQGFCPINCQSGDVSRNNAQITDVWTISPNVINELRLGYTNQLNFFVPATLGQGFPAKLGWQYAKADIFPIISVSGFYQLTSNINAVYKEHVYDPSDVVTLIRGKHILHFGGEYLFFRDNSTAWGNTNGGTMNHTGAYTQETQGLTSTGLSFADFLLGQTHDWNATVTPEFGGRIQLPQLFVQDDFKVKPNLTLNIGLRYQIQTGWGEVKGNMRTFDPTIQNPATGTLGAMWYGSTHANGRTTLQAPNYSTFLPRVGFSWSPMPNTVLRGGFGLYAYNWSLDTYGSGMGNAFGSTGSAADQTNGVTPYLILGSSGSSLPYIAATTDPSKFNGNGVNGNMYHTPVGGSYQWNLEAERQIGNDLVFDLAYVASHGHDLPFPVDVNQIPENRLGPTDVALGFRPYPQYQGISESTNNALSNYNSLQAVVTKRMSHGLNFTFNYVWSHFLDNIDSSGWGSRAGVQAYQSSYNPSANYSNSNFDVRNAFKGSAVYQLPFGKGKQFLNNNTFLDEVVGGWQATGTLVLQGGQPYTVTMKTNNSYAQAGSWFPNLIGNPKLANRGPYHGTNQWFNEAAFAQPANGTFGTFRRNTLYGPALDRTNFSLGKTFAIHESIGLQIRADANNIFNHPSFQLPSSSLAVCSDTTSSGCVGSAVGAVATGTSTIRSTTVGGRTMQLGARLTF
jgi:hypothetical protein